MVTFKEFIAKHLPYAEQFKSSLLWNFFDSIGSQGLLILYHVSFRHFFGTLLHGIMGCSLSLFYVAVIIFNFGLDQAIAPFLESITSHKQNMRSFIKTVLVPQFFLLLALALLWYYAHSKLLAFKILHFIAPHLTHNLAIITSSTFVIESMRKSLRSFLQLNFYTRLTALVEVAGIGLYVLIIIAIHVLYHSLSLEKSWQMLLLISLLQLLLLILGMIHLYYTVPDMPQNQHTVSYFNRLLKSRIFIWGNQTLNQSFSANFLVPLCAIHFGIEQASLMKVMTSISSWITLIANKVFGVTSNALLAHLKSRSLATQRAAFHYLTSLLNNALYFLFIFLAINGKKIALLQINNLETISWSALYILLIIALFESLFVLYEKWYIIEEKAHYYLFFNGLCIIGIYSIIRHITAPMYLLLTVMSFRLATFVFLSLFSFYWWHIRPSFKPSILIGSLALITSMIFFILI